MCGQQVSGYALQPAASSL